MVVVVVVVREEKGRRSGEEGEWQKEILACRGA